VIRTIAIAAFFSVGLMLPACAQDAVPLQPPPVKQIVAKKIILVGDSTMQVQSGWGGSFCAEHVTSFLACVDLGRGGRSSMSYRAEGSWDLALAEMKTPGFEAVYVLIQFGHNDQPGKPGRSTDLKTEFPVNIARYVTETRAAGAIPVLVTPLTRRGFKDGKLADNLQPWADAVVKVAEEMNVPLVDLHARSMAAVQAMGAAEAAKLAQVPPPADFLDAAKAGTTKQSDAANPDKPFLPPVETPPPPVEGMAAAKLSFDYTHVGRAGADVFSAIVARELAKAVPDLRNELIP
jgi:lysophospholipase L1-like esterase